jgi:mannitol-1-phosphate 5-dehydrogenase
MKAVHFGAGNIGRGFIGALLQDAGYHVVFADVNQELLNELSHKGSYELIEVGEGGRRVNYSNFSCVNSATEANLLIGQIAEADVVTASVGAAILPRIAATIAKGIDSRSSATPLLIMACENAVNASDLLADEVAKYTSHLAKAIFANTAVDRIVPIQSGDISPSVEVEAFSELVIENRNLKEVAIDIPGAKLVSDLAPYIERKLYTVNTAHCATAYLGQKAGFETIASSLKDKMIHDQVLSVLKETSLALVLKHGLDPRDQASYVAKTMSRLQNPMIDDSVERVGRDPIRKLSRTERLIGPAAYLAENGRVPSAILEVVSAALDFHSPDDASVTQLGEMLQDLSADDFVESVCGVEHGHPLFEAMVEVANSHKTVRA